jgi:hypothetical protein
MVFLLGNPLEVRTVNRDEVWQVQVRLKTERLRLPRPPSWGGQAPPGTPPWAKKSATPTFLPTTRRARNAAHVYMMYAPYTVLGRCVLTLSKRSLTLTK